MNDILAKMLKYSDLLCSLVTVTFLLSNSARAEFPPELVNFKPHTDNPIFTSRGPGHWDEKIRERGWILRDGGKYHMWFTGYQTRPMKLGYATSPDGIKWQRHPENPIYSDHWVEDMMVIKRDDTFYMFAEGLNDIPHLFTSTDGIKWDRQGKLDVRYTNGTPLTHGPYGTPTVWYENAKWHLFYERRDEAIWLASSVDLKVWTNVQDEPVLRPGPDDYDRDMIALNQIIKHKGRYYAYFHGLGRANGNNNWTTNVAVSDDLIHWRKYRANPLFPTSDDKSSGILVHDGHRFRMYTMHKEVHLHFSNSPRKSD